MTKYKFWMAVLIGILLLAGVTAGVAVGVYTAFYERESTDWVEVVRLWNEQPLEVRQSYSQRVYHGNPHAFGWGGGDPRSEVTFNVDGTTYRWEGGYIPIAIQKDSSGIYIVVFDRETPNHTGFRLYRAKGPSVWDEIPPSDFPKHLAIQNTWLREDNEIVAKMDPGDNWFRRSLTARLWSYLIDPAFKYEVVPDEKFARQFKAQWIQKAGNELPQNP